MTIISQLRLIFRDYSDEFPVNFTTNSITRRDFPCRCGCNQDAVRLSGHRTDATLPPA
jgi:hypothetical protein